MAKHNLVQVVFDRENVRPDDDVMVITMHTRMVIEGAPDLLDMTQEGRDDFTQKLNSWWQTVNGYISSKVILREARFYDVPSSFGQDMGPPVYVPAFGTPGTSGNELLPPQCAMSVTFKTDKRKTWGRFYIPGITTVAIDANGAWQLAVATQVAQATHTLTARAGTGACLTVFSRKEWTHHDPQEIQIDDIVDVIRRRRYEKPNFRHTVSAG